jgi:hypothetical protein
MISLVPVENAGERERVVEEAHAHGEAHATPNGSWSKLYVAPAPAVEIAARGITFDALRAALGDGWVAFDEVSSEFIDYPGISQTPFALRGRETELVDGDHENVVYGLLDGVTVRQLCLTRCRPPMTDVLHRLCTTFRLIISDLWRNEVVDPDAGDPAVLGRYLAPESE